MVGVFLGDFELFWFSFHCLFYERRQRAMHQKAEEQERKIVESHTRKLQKEQAERDYYEALLDQKQVKVKQAARQVKKERFKRAKERFELGNAKTQRHQENYRSEKVENRVTHS